MIATVTLNPAIDKTIVIPGFAIGKTNRGAVEKVDAGGKGINVAKAVRQLGCPVTATGFLGGANGTHIAEALAAANIPADFVWVPGETRVNLKIQDPISGVETEVNEAGFRVDAAHVAELERKIEQIAARSSVMVFSGSLPPGVAADVYSRFIRIARSCGARTILDAAGEALRLGVAEAPDLIKPNKAEAEELLGGTIDNEGRAARMLLAQGPATVVISLGPGGAIAATRGEMWRSRPPAVRTASSIGAGDAMVAAFAVAMIRNMPLADALRLATAAAAATVATDGTAADLSHVQDLVPRVVLERITEAMDAR